MIRRAVFSLILTFTTASLMAQIDSIQGSSWLLNKVQVCFLDTGNVIVECNDTIDVYDKNIRFSILNSTKLLFYDVEYYYWMPTNDSLLISLNNFSKKERYSSLGVDVEVFTLRLANGIMYFENKVEGYYGEYLDFSFGEITRYIWER